MKRPEEWLTDDIPENVRKSFEAHALDLISRGHRRASSDRILHAVRQSYECNDHWTSRLARWFMAKHPRHSGFFTLRALRH